MNKEILFTVASLFCAVGLLFIYTSNLEIGRPIFSSIRDLAVAQAISSSVTANLVESDQDVLKLRKLKNEILDLKDKTSIQNKAIERRQVADRLIRRDASKFLAEHFTSKEKSGLPPEAVSNIEQEIKLSGKIEVLHQDDFSNGANSDFKYKLKTSDGQKLDLFSTRDLSLPSGSTIQVSGVRLGNTLAINGGADDTEIISKASLDSVGEQKTLVVLLDGGSSPRPFSFVEAKNILTNSAFHAYIKEQSYNRTYFTFDVLDWYPLSTYPNMCGSDFADAFLPAITAANIDLSKYGRVLVMLSPGGGGCSSVGKFDYSRNGQTYKLSIAWVGLSNWSRQSSWGIQPFTWTNLDFLLAHELGHSLGLWHANGWDCGGQSNIGSCQHFEYGNYFDAMGSKSNSLHFNAYYKDALGWLDSSRVLSINASGRYTVNPLEFSWGTALAKIKGPQSNAPFYYALETRRPIGFDLNLGNGELQINTKGLLINKIVDRGLTTRLIDAQPTSLDWWYDLDQSALVGNSVFYDPSAGIVIGPVFSSDNNSTNFYVGVQQAPAPTANMSALYPVATSTDFADKLNYNFNSSKTYESLSVRHRGDPVGIKVDSLNAFECTVYGEGYPFWSWNGDHGGPFIFSAWQSSVLDLACNGAGGGVKDSITILVPAEIFATVNSGDSATIKKGDAVFLSWAFSDNRPSSSCSVLETYSGERFSGDGLNGIWGNVQRFPSTSTKYLVNCSDGFGGNASKELSVEVVDKGSILTPNIPTADIKVNGLDELPAAVAFGSQVNVSWTSSNVDLCAVSPTGWRELEGSSYSQVFSSTIFNLDCTGVYGGARDRVFVEVLPPPPQSPPSVNIKVNGLEGPISVDYGGNATLSWSSSGATSCTIYRNGTNPVSISLSGQGTASNITAQRIYTISCSGSGTTVSDSVTINVQQNTPVTETQTQTPPSTVNTVAPSSVGYDTSSNANNTNTNSLSYAINVGSQNNRVVVVGVETEAGDQTACSAASVTVNGNNAVKIDESKVGTSPVMCVSLWYYLNPSSGTNSISVRTSGTVTDLISGATSLYGAYQGAPYVTAKNSNSGQSSISTAINATYQGSMIVDTVGHGYTGALTPTGGSGQIERYDRMGNSARGAGSTYAQSVGVSVALGWNYSSSVTRMAHVVAAFKPAGQTSLLDSSSQKAKKNNFLASILEALSRIAR